MKLINKDTNKIVQLGEIAYYHGVGLCTIVEINEPCWLHPKGAVILHANEYDRYTIEPGMLGAVWAADSYNHTE